MVRFLEHANRGEKARERPARIARVQAVFPGGSANKFIELWVDLDQAAILKEEHLIGKHPYIDSDYMQAVEKACMADPKVQEHIAHLQLPDGASVIVEAWAYATDGTNDMSQQTTMVNHAYPTPICPTTIKNEMLTWCIVLVLHALGG